MYKNWDKKTSKRYLLCAFGILFACFGITAILMLAFSKNGYTVVELSGGRILFISLISSLIPMFSFTGFMVFMIRIDTLSTKKLVFIVVFCVPIVIAMVPFGAIMFVPTTVKSIQHIMIK